PNIIRAPLECQSQYTQALAAQGPERAVYLAQKTTALILIDVHDLVEQAEVVTMLSGHSPEGHHILGKARSSVADPGIQEARIGADPVHYLLRIRSDQFAHRRYRIDERDLHRQKGVTGMLGQFRALAAGYNQRRRDRGAIRLRNGFRALVIAGVGQRGVDFAK